jgi:hypothetical protein
MKTKEEIKELMTSSLKIIEKNIDIKIRNGQAAEGVRKALNWVLQ